MSKRDWLVFMATSQGYLPSDEDTDTDLVWVIRNYVNSVPCRSRKGRSDRKAGAKSREQSAV